jgi:hypothetical protein
MKFAARHFEYGSWEGLSGHIELYISDEDMIQIVAEKQTFSCGKLHRPRTVVLKTWVDL